MPGLLSNEDIEKVGVGLPIRKCGEIELRVCPQIDDPSVDNDLSITKSLWLQHRRRILHPERPSLAASEPNKSDGRSPRNL
jgi:hypothetical protein